LSLVPSGVRRTAAGRSPALSVGEPPSAPRVRRSGSPPPPSYGLTGAAADRTDRLPPPSVTGNPYAYSWHSPITFVDPDGQWPGLDEEGGQRGHQHTWRCDLRLAPRMGNASDGRSRIDHARRVGRSAGGRNEASIRSATSALASLAHSSADVSAPDQRRWNGLLANFLHGSGTDGSLRRRGSAMAISVPFSLGGIPDSKHPRGLSARQRSR